MRQEQGNWNEAENNAEKKKSAIQLRVGLSIADLTVKITQQQVAVV